MARSPAVTRRFDLRRVHTAVLLVPALYAVIRYLPPWALTLLLIAGGSIALMELYRISFQSYPNRVLIGVGLVTFALIVVQHYLSLGLMDLLIVSTLALLLAMLFSSTPIEHRLKDSTVALFGVLYLGLTLSTLVSTRALPAGEWFVLFVALVTWAADTGAYYAGTLWGKHLVAPSVSPKKTVEGLLGGMALAVGCAFLAHAWFLPQLSKLDMLILGILLTGSGLLGDLCESAIKRSVGVKDSGGILPGHGGMLDRLDSLLFTAPTFYYYVTWVRGISPP
ncbi:MAG: phosphatidate cytidylyltransferase [Nitrospirae bacterium]|nr:phosphatidate cytidylyltransferase [Nitrospirota bacterium]